MSCHIVVHTNLHGALIGCLTIADVNQLQLSMLQHIEMIHCVVNDSFSLVEMIHCR